MQPAVVKMKKWCFSEYCITHDSITSVSRPKGNTVLDMCSSHIASHRLLCAGDALQLRPLWLSQQRSEASGEHNASHILCGSPESAGAPSHRIRNNSKCQRTQREASIRRWQSIKLVPVPVPASILVRLLQVTIISLVNVHLLCYNNLELA